MSIEGYFKGVIRNWKSVEKRTPTLKNDMKIIINQFNISVADGDIPNDLVEELKKEFKKIYDEVYN